MIKLTEHMQSLLPFHKTVFGCRILATAQAYGLSEPFARFWMQDEDGAAICMLDDTVILDVGAHADYDELKEFIRMTGAQRLLCDAESAQKLGYPVVRRGQVMVYQGSSPSRLGDFERNPGVRELYALISECATETFEPPEFESFYMDLSHRIRHDAAAAVGMRFQGKLVSCAVCSAKTQDAAVLSAVCVHPAHRRRGYGHGALSAMVYLMRGKKVYILRAEKENEEFYRSFGFADCGEFVESSI